MATTWHRLIDELPKDGDECLLMPESRRVLGPIHYTDKETSDGKRIKGWLELYNYGLATASGGTFIPYNAKDITHWALASEFSLPK